MTPTDMHIYMNIYIYASYELQRPLVTPLGIKTYQINPLAQGEHPPGQLALYGGTSYVIYTRNALGGMSK